jgi:hypothetical protein
MKKKYRIFGEYVGHLGIGAGMFAALLIFGGAVNEMVRLADGIIGDSTFLNLMEVVEKVILYADVVFIVWWAIYSTYKAIKEMRDDDNE